MIFGIETSTPQASLALVKGTRIVCEVRTSGEVRHSDTIFQIADGMLTEYDPERNKIRGIAVSIGPGMFTALRVGLTLAKGLAYAIGAPLVGVNTLDAMACSVSTPMPNLCPLVPAGRGDLYCALYRNAKGRPKLISPYLLVKPEQIVRRIRMKEALVFGPGLEIFKDVLRSCVKNRIRFAEKNILAPPASVVARIGEEKLARGITDDLDRLEPFYLKKPDVLTAKDRKYKRR